LTKLGEKR